MRNRLYWMVSTTFSWWAAPKKFQIGGELSAQLSVACCCLSYVEVFTVLILATIKSIVELLKWLSSSFSFNVFWLRNWDQLTVLAAPRRVTEVNFVDFSFLFGIVLRWLSYWSRLFVRNCLFWKTCCGQGRPWLLCLLSDSSSFWRTVCSWFLRDRCGLSRSEPCSLAIALRIAWCIVGHEPNDVVSTPCRASLRETYQGCTPSNEVCYSSAVALPCNRLREMERSGFYGKKKIDSPTWSRKLVPQALVANECELRFHGNKWVEFPESKWS